MEEGTNYLDAAASLFNAFAWERLVPFLTLLAIVLVVYLTIRTAQYNKESAFDFTEFFREEVSGKLSLKKLLGFGCFIGHSWYFYMRTVSDKITFDDTILYCVVWSASPILLEALAVWRGIATPPKPPMS